MFNIGPLEFLIVAVLAIAVVGPSRLPQMMKQAGKFFVKIRRTASEVRSSFDQVLHEAEEEVRQEELQELRQALTKQLGKPLAPGEQSSSHPLPQEHSLPQEKVSEEKKVHDS